VPLAKIMSCSLLFSLSINIGVFATGHDTQSEAGQHTPPLQTIQIATGEFAPWSGKHLPHNGHVNHIIQEAFAAQKIAVEFVYLPWKRAFEETRLGKFDGTSYWYENTERRDTMLFSDPLIINRTVFFQHADMDPIQWKSFSDLNSYRMSATVGFTYTEDFYRAIDAQIINPIMVPSDLQNIKLLMANRVDIFVTDEMAGFYMAAQLSVDPHKLKVIEPALSTPQGHLLASKINPNSQWVIETFNTGLQKIKVNGTYKRILNRVDNNSFYNPTVSLLNAPPPP
jgi:polar amino acid transport system substrate-binding protein